MNKGVPLRETVKRGAERNTLKRERKREKGGKKEKKIESVDPVVQITKIKGTSSSPFHLPYLLNVPPISKF